MDGSNPVQYVFMTGPVDLSCFFYQLGSKLALLTDLVTTVRAHMHTPTPTAQYECVCVCVSMSRPCHGQCSTWFSLP